MGRDPAYYPARCNSCTGKYRKHYPAYQGGYTGADAAGLHQICPCQGCDCPQRSFGHALKNTLIPVITILGLQVGDLIAFTTITETIFAWPGMGKMILDAISHNDRPIISAYLMLVSAMFILINFIVDVLYTLIDPRVSLTEG